MSDYLLIESRDPFESGCSHYHELACQLADRGKQVTLFLVQNAVLVTRPCKHSEQLKEIASKGVEILADEFRFVSVELTHLFWLKVFRNHHSIR